MACGRTIKFHFCRANVFELAIKQRFSPPSQRTTRPRGAALAPSRFLFTHQRTGFAVYTVSSVPFPPSLRLPRRSSLRHSLPSSSGRTESYFGVRKYTRRALRGMSTSGRWRTARVPSLSASMTKISIDAKCRMSAMRKNIYKIFFHANSSDIIIRENPRRCPLNNRLRARGIK